MLAQTHKSRFLFAANVYFSGTDSEMKFAGNPNATAHLNDTKDVHKLRGKLHLHRHGDQSESQ